MTMIKTDATNVSLYVYFVDDDGGTAPGEPTTGKLFSDIETGGSASYMRQGAARVDLTLKTLASASAAYDEGGFILVDDTNMPGLYRVDVPDAAFATGVAFVVIQMVMASANNSIMRPLLVNLTETVVEAVWDEVLTGGTHNVVNSAGRRLRIIQESGSYEGGAVWIDTVNGTAGTTNFENGVDILPVTLIADANTIATSVGLSRFQVAPGSSITFAAAQTDETWEGRDWALALGGQNIDGSFIFGATVTGTGIATGDYELEECDIGAVTLDNGGHFELCGLEGTFTVGQAGTFIFHDCFTEAAGTITIDFGALGATTINMFAFNGDIAPTNMAAGDVLHITGAGDITTATCTGGTIDHDGFFEYTDAGGNVTEIQSDIKVAVDAIKVPTDKMVFTKTNELDANTKSINDAEVVGDGNATPWDGV